MQCLIDADVLAYRFASAAEEETEWHDGIWTLHANLNEAVANLDSFIEEVKENVEADDVRLFLSHSTNFRKLVWPEYKANRSSKRKPILLKELRRHMLQNWGAEERTGVEADDLLGLAGYKRTDRIICTIDKDLRTVEGMHFNWDRAEEGILKVNTKAAATQFYTQVLTGDAVDHFPGLPGCGPKTASKLLEDCKSVKDMWKRVIDAYSKKGLNPEDALTQARCAYILKRKSDFKNGSVQLWNPPKI